MRTLCAALALAAVCCPAVVSAGELQGAAGLAGPASGWSVPLTSQLLLRGELAPMGLVGRDSIEEGVSYSSMLRPDRAAFRMDWFVRGDLRVTGGLTFNGMRVDLRGHGPAGAALLGDAQFTGLNGERGDAASRWPPALPYLGIGYGRPVPGGGTFLFDIGGTFVQASLSEQRQGPPLGLGTQAELERQLAVLHEGFGRYRFSPQVSFGVNLPF